jgi:hypothetical protein
VLDELTDLRRAAVDCAEAPVWALSDSDLLACVDAAHAAMQALAATTLHLIHQVDSRDLPRQQHARSSAGWVQSRLLVRAGSGKSLATLAAAVDRRPHLDRALTAGAVNVEHVSVIDACLRSLPSEIGVEAADKAEAILIDAAAELGPAELRKVADYVLQRVAPEVAERLEADALRRAEERADASRYLRFSLPHEGKVRFTGRLDVESAAIVHAALDPLCSPRTTASTIRPLDAGEPFDRAVADDRTFEQRRADALVDVCRLVLSTGELPVNGGDRPQVVVTVPFEVLRGELGAATLDTGERLSPAQARRMACDALILPAVLGGESQVLDVGRTRRLATGSLRRALVLRDGGCAFPGCDRPARWTDAHHIESWVDGGPTTLDNLVLLCRHHHRTLHRSEWTVRIGVDGHPEFIPPSWLDPRRHPRRNRFHRRT